MINKWLLKTPAVLLINRLGEGLSQLGIRPSLSERSIVTAAQRNAGIKAHRCNDFVEPLRKLLADMEKEAELSTFGRFFMRQRLVDALTIRFQVDDMIERHPQIMSQTLADIWIIGALPRTGTTLLQRMLAVDPDTRPILTWEAIYPVPPQLKLGQKDRRKQKVKWLERLLRMLAPQFFAIHPLEHDAPEEDLIIMQQTFLSQAAEGAMHVPNYARWLESADKISAYKHLEKVLKILQWQQPKKRWLLKNPFHMEDLDTLFKVFPQAKIIQTHRDLLEVVPSVCSLSAYSRGIVSNHVDGKVIGQHWLRKYQYMTDSCMEARAHLNPEQFIDILYDDLVQDPFSEIEKIYQHFKVDFSDEIKRSMQNHSQLNTKNKYGRHDYNLEEFSLSRDSIVRIFKRYSQIYGVVSKKL